MQFPATRQGAWSYVFCAPGRECLDFSQLLLPVELLGPSSLLEVCRGTRKSILAAKRWDARTDQGSQRPDIQKV